MSETSSNSPEVQINALVQRVDKLIHYDFSGVKGAARPVEKRKTPLAEFRIAKMVSQPGKEPMSLVDFAGQNLANITAGVFGRNSERFQQLIGDKTQLTPEETVNVIEAIFGEVGEKGMDALQKIKRTLPGVSDIDLLPALQGVAVDAIPNEVVQTKKYSLEGLSKDEAASRRRVAHGFSWDEQGNLMLDKKAMDIFEGKDLARTVEIDMRSAQALFNLLAPPADLVEIQELELKLKEAKNNPDEANRLSHQIVEKRQRIYKAMLSAFGAQQETEEGAKPIAGEDVDKQLAQDIKTRYDQLRTITTANKEVLTRNILEANRESTFQMVEAAGVEIPKEIQEQILAGELTDIEGKLTIPEGKKALVHAILTQRKNTERRLHELKNIDPEFTLLEGTEFFMGLKGVDLLLRRSHTPEEIVTTEKKRGPQDVAEYGIQQGPPERVQKPTSTALTTISAPPTKPEDTAEKTRELLDRLAREAVATQKTPSRPETQPLSPPQLAPPKEQASPPLQLESPKPLELDNARFQPPEITGGQKLIVDEIKHLTGLFDSVKEGQIPVQRFAMELSEFRPRLTDLEWNQFEGLVNTLASNNRNKLNYPAFTEVLLDLRNKNEGRAERNADAINFVQSLAKEGKLNAELARDYMSFLKGEPAPASIDEITTAFKALLAQGKITREEYDSAIMDFTGRSTNAERVGAFRDLQRQKGADRLERLKRTREQIRRKTPRETTTEQRHINIRTGPTMTAVQRENERAVEEAIRHEAEKSERAAQVANREKKILNDRLGFLGGSENEANPAQALCQKYQEKDPGHVRMYNLEDAIKLAQENPRIFKDLYGVDAPKNEKEISVIVAHALAESLILSALSPETHNTLVAKAQAEGERLYREKAEGDDRTLSNFVDQVYLHDLEQGGEGREFKVALARDKNQAVYDRLKADLEKAFSQIPVSVAPPLSRPPAPSPAPVTSPPVEQTKVQESAPQVQEILEAAVTPPQEDQRESTASPATREASEAVRREVDGILRSTLEKLQIEIEGEEAPAEALYKYYHKEAQFRDPDNLLPYLLAASLGLTDKDGHYKTDDLTERILQLDDEVYRELREQIKEAAGLKPKVVKATTPPGEAAAAVTKTSPLTAEVPTTPSAPSPEPEFSTSEAAAKPISAVESSIPTRTVVETEAAQTEAAEQVAVPEKEIPDFVRRVQLGNESVNEMQKVYEGEKRYDAVTRQGDLRVRNARVWVGTNQGSVMGSDSTLAYVDQVISAGIDGVEYIENQSSLHLGQITNHGSEFKSFVHLSGTASLYYESSDLADLAIAIQDDPVIFFNSTFSGKRDELEEACAKATGPFELTQEEIRLKIYVLPPLPSPHEIVNQPFSFGVRDVPEGNYALVDHERQIDGEHIEKRRFLLATGWNGVSAADAMFELAAVEKSDGTQELKWVFVDGGAIPADLYGRLQEKTGFHFEVTGESAAPPPPPPSEPQWTNWRRAQQEVGDAQAELNERQEEMEAPVEEVAQVLEGKKVSRESLLAKLAGRFRPHTKESQEAQQIQKKAKEIKRAAKKLLRKGLHQEDVDTLVDHWESINRRISTESLMAEQFAKAYGRILSAEAEEAANIERLALEQRNWLQKKLLPYLGIAFLPDAKAEIFLNTLRLIGINLPEDVERNPQEVYGAKEGNAVLSRIKGIALLIQEL